MTSSVLVTGAEGFVGNHLFELLGDQAVAGDADVTDREAVAAAVRGIQPRAVVHLAAQSSVAASWGDVANAWNVNVFGTVNVLEAVRGEQPDARVIFPSTGEVYGSTEQLPTPEDAPIAPISPYAATKAAAEVACAQFARSGGDVVVARAFNHEGPGRDDRFAIGSWTRQIAVLEKEGGGVLEVGDLTVERDLTDVRDVCRAYALLLEPTIASGIYNVASGNSVSMAKVVELLVSLARCPVEVEQRRERMRPVDVPVIRGDASRLERATGWRPEIPLERSLSDALDYARTTLAPDQAAAT